MKKIVYSTVFVVVVYAAVYLYCRFNLWDVEYYRSIVLWTVFFIGFINFCVAMANPLAGVISAVLYPFIVYLSNRLADSYSMGNRICLYSGIAVLIITSVVTYQVKKRRGDEKKP